LGGNPLQIIPFHRSQLISLSTSVNNACQELTEKDLKLSTLNFCDMIMKLTEEGLGSGILEIEKTDTGICFVYEFGEEQVANI
jgi:hypothetical protein